MEAWSRAMPLQSNSDSAKLSAEGEELVNRALKANVWYNLNEKQYELLKDYRDHVEERKKKTWS